jgi:hypothetical protein
MNFFKAALTLDLLTGTPPYILPGFSQFHDNYNELNESTLKTLLLLLLLFGL